MNKRKNMVRWTEEEWDELSAIVFLMRRNDPIPPLTVLVERAVKQFPEDRRRKITTPNQIEPLLVRLKALNDDLRNRADKADMLEDRLETFERETQSREDILSSISDEELLNRYGNRILLKLLDTYHAQRAASLLPQEIPRASTNQLEQIVEDNRPPKAPERKRKVVIVGPRGDQKNILQRKLSEYDLHCYKESPGSLPKADLYIQWIDFTNHTVQGLPSEHIKFTGGLNRMVELIKNRLPLT